MSVMLDNRSEIGNNISESSKVQSKLFGKNDFLKKNQMKNGLYLIITFISLSLSNGVIAQSETRQIRKEVQMEMLDYVITLTITTIDGDKITEEIYTGEEAKQKIKEKYKFNFDFYLCDEKALKTVVRSNPGILELNKGTVMQKVHWNDLEDLKL